MYAFAEIFELENDSDDEFGITSVELYFFILLLENIFVRFFKELN